MQIFVRLTMTANDPVRWIISATIDAELTAFARELIVVTTDNQKKALQIVGEILALLTAKKSQIRPANDNCSEKNCQFKLPGASAHSRTEAQVMKWENAFSLATFAAPALLQNFGGEE